jgi:hypothetical protein
LGGKKIGIEIIKDYRHQILGGKRKRGERKNIEGAKDIKRR